MPKWMTVAFALFLSLQVFSTKGETVDDVINKYVKAMGGRDRLASIKTLYYEGITIGEGGDKVIIRTHKVQDKLFRRELFSGSEDKLVIITDSSGWDSGSRLGNNFQRLTYEEIGSWRADLDCSGPLFDYVSKGSTAELLGKENVNGTACYKVKLTLKSGLIVNYFINAGSWYIIRESHTGFNSTSPGQVSEMITDYSDFRKTKEGYVFPFKEFRITPSTETVSYGMIEVNKQVNYRLYEPVNQ